MTTNDLPAIEQMKAQGDIEGLAGALRDPDEATRRAAIEALVAAADARTYDVMRPLTDDPDQNVRAAALEVMLRAAAGNRAAQPAQPTSQQPLSSGQKLALHAGMFLAGAILWGLAIAFLVLMASLKLGGLTWLGVIVGLMPLGFLAARSVENWGLTYVNKRGEPDAFYKVGVYLFFLFAGFGILLSCYWTGRSLLRAYLERQSDLFARPLPQWFLTWLVRGSN